MFSAVMALDVPSGYRALKEGDVAAYLAGLPAIVTRLGGTPGDWRVREVGDGNLNLVFIVEGPASGVVVKQALPYVRLVGESWPLSLKRSFFEHQALTAQARLVPQHVPEIFHFDAGLALIVMAYLKPHIILRKGLIRGIVYPRLAEHMATFMAGTLFGTSDLGQPAADKKRQVALFCANTDLCRITEDLVFTDPWRIADANRWTSPQLDAAAAAVRADGPWKRAAQELKLEFLGNAQAMIHGDLHSGSIMVTETETFAIDPEFAFYGPMGFDIGALISNLYLAFFSQSGHEARPGERDGYRRWILQTAEAVWRLFDHRFRTLWNTAHAGDAFLPGLFADTLIDGGPDALKAAQDAYMRRLFVDALGFAGAKMTRRILGLAHVEDMESIADPDLRATCEKRALKLARSLMVERASVTDIEAVSDAARAIQRETMT
jgi:5-methylthioribose kinase